MKEKPILFSGPMVRALLAGTKTQTRRIVKPQPVPMPADVQRTSPFDDSGYWWAAAFAGSMVSLFDAPCMCPYGYKGDRLWVKETFSAHGAFKDSGRKSYRADIPDGREPHGLRWKPSIFCTRKASRITLEVTSVRIERLNVIGGGGALAEGVSSTEFWNPKELDSRPFEEKWWDDYHFWSNYPQIVYRKLWESINGAGSWDLNPWVWVIEFKKVAQ